jgi:hypothetical protein
MLNAAVRTVNRIHADTPVDFVLLGGDNTDNAQSNELGWFLGILDGAPQVHCDSADDNDIVPGPDNDPKDPFGPVALDVPWRWVTGNHDILRQGTWPLAKFASEPIGTSATGGTRDYSQPGSPIVIGTVLADPARAFVDEAEQLARMSEAGDGHGIDAGALALGRAFYTFDVDGGPLRIFVLSSAAATGALHRPHPPGRHRRDHRAHPASRRRRRQARHHHLAPPLHLAQERRRARPRGRRGVRRRPHARRVGRLPRHPRSRDHAPRRPLPHHARRPPAPMGGHAYWEVASPALADFPHELRLVEVWDQDNGSLTIRTVAFDFVADDDPIADEGRTIGVIDFTSFWEGDGRGLAPSDRNVELWIAKP